MGGNHLKSEKEKLLKSAVLDWAKAIIIAVVLALLIPNFLFAPYLVDGESMDPTLHDRERIFVNMTVKYISDFKREDRRSERRKRALCQTDYRTSRRHGANEKRSAVHQRQKVSEPYLAANKHKAKQGGFDRLTEDFYR